MFLSGFLQGEIEQWAGPGIRQLFDDQQRDVLSMGCPQRVTPHPGDRYLGPGLLGLTPKFPWKW